MFIIILVLKLTQDSKGIPEPVFYGDLVYNTNNCWKAFFV